MKLLGADFVSTISILQCVLVVLFFKRRITTTTTVDRSLYKIESHQQFQSNFMMDDERSVFLKISFCGTNIPLLVTCQ